MPAGVFIDTLCAHWPTAIIIVVVSHLLRNKYHNKLNRYPGDPLAGYTNLWRFFDALRRTPEKTHIALHQKHGDIVRLGPNVLSFSSPRAIKVIYGLNRGMTKSDFYPVQQAVVNGQRLESLFSTQDEDYHAKYRRCVNSAFAMSSLVGYEPLVDSTIDAFVAQTQHLYCDQGKVCDFSKWLQFFAFDVIGELTWSKRLGFVERGEDVEGIVKFVSDFLSYAGPVGQMPWLDLLLWKNPILLTLQRWGISQVIFPVTRFAQAQSAGRSEESEEIKQIGSINRSGGAGGVDLLTKFTQAQQDHPDFMTDKQVLASCTSMIFAGSETTAISLSSVFYYLVKNPRVYEKLMSEIDDSVRNGTITERDNGKVSWAESQQLPYLDAVIQESFRMHPAAGLILERVVPPQGLDVLGEYIPGGTIVGCSAWVLHRSAVFGQDVEVFRPERWLAADPEQLRTMKATMFQFGAGSRTCIGKNISLMEIYKLVPTFLRNFEIELARPDTDWRTKNAWFVRQVDFMTTFRQRKMASGLQSS